MQIPATDDLSDLERTRGAFTILGRDATHAKTFQTFKNFQGPQLQ